MIYDGYDFDHLLTVDNVERPILPTVDVQATDLDGADGSIVRNVRLQSIQIDVDIRLNRPCDENPEMDVEFEKIRRLLAEKLIRRHPCKLVLDDAPDLYHMAVLSDSTEIDKLVYSREATLGWYCADPVGYGREHAKQSDDGSAIKCSVHGTYPTRPLITVETTDSNAVVTVDGETMTALGNISSSQPLVFDCSNRRITKGESIVKMSIYDDYAEWEPGIHTISCDFPFAVRWVERWL